MTRLDGKIVIITGGTSGIGLAAARQVVAEGGTAAITGRDPERGEKAVVELGSDRVSYHRHDVRSRPSWDAVVAEVLERHGRIDALVNNAGISASRCRWRQPPTSTTWSASTSRGRSTACRPSSPR